MVNTWPAITTTELVGELPFGNDDMEFKNLGSRFNQDSALLALIGKVNYHTGAGHWCKNKVDNLDLTIILDVSSV